MRVQAKRSRFHVPYSFKFRSQKFRKNVENHTNINFCDKNFVIARAKPTPIAEFWTIVSFREK